MVMRAVRTTTALPSDVWAQMLELWEDDPDGFVLLATAVSRMERPPWGSVTLTLAAGKSIGIEVRKTTKV